MKKPLRPCNYLGCSELVEKGYCERHQRPKYDKDYDRKRGTAHQRGYDFKWAKFRKYYLRKYPICKKCQGLALLIHHIQPLVRGGAKYDEDNLMSLCFKCHAKIHGQINS